MHQGDSLQAGRHALKGWTVLDASQSIAGQFCGRLLADYGAMVHLAEPAWGVITRRTGTVDAAGVSYLFRHLNAGKTSLAVDDDETFSRAATEADIVIVDGARRRDIALSVNPRAIIGVATDFGIDGPMAGWRGSELIFQALSGGMPSNGHVGRSPLYGCGNRASFAAGVALYIGLLSAWLERRRSGAGQVVDIATAEVAASMTIAPATHAYSGQESRRASKAQSMIRCGDDWVLLWCYPYQWKDFCEALYSTDLMEDERFIDHNTRATHWAELISVQQQRHADTPADEIVARLRARRLITAKAQRLSTLAADPHLAARGAIMLEQGRASLAAPFRLTAYASDGSPAPVGQGRAPLAGLRVLDLTTAWAGPMAGRILAFLGADVIHVEHASKPDLWRHHRQVYNAALYAGSDADGPRYNRNVLFNSQNLGKRSLSLDLKATAGRDAAYRVAQKCDVILTNFTPGAIDRMGLGYASLSHDNPNIVVCEMPAYGMWGPDSGALAVGNTMEMASGMAGLIGYSDSSPINTGPNYPDPIGGLNAAAGILTALVRRATIGVGAHVEIPQVEAAMQFIGAEILEAVETGMDPIRNGNRITTHAPHDVYPAQGAHQWIAISAPTDEAWQGLVEEIDPELARDQRFANGAARLAHQDELDERIAAWTIGRNKHEVAALLQARGVTAAPVLDAGEVATHPFYLHRKYFVSLTHPAAGTRQYPTVPIRLNRTPGSDSSAAPCLGQHTDEVLADFGIGFEERAALALAGVTASKPI